METVSNHGHHGHHGDIDLPEEQAASASSADVKQNQPLGVLQEVVNSGTDMTPAVPVAPCGGRDHSGDERSPDCCVKLDLTPQMIEECEKLQLGRTIKLTGQEDESRSDAAVVMKLTRQQQGALTMSLFANSISETLNKKLSFIWKCNIVKDDSDDIMEEKDGSETMVTRETTTTTTGTEDKHTQTENITADQACEKNTSHNHKLHSSRRSKRKVSQHSPPSTKLEGVLGSQESAAQVKSPRKRGRPKKILLVKDQEDPSQGTTDELGGTSDSPAAGTMQEPERRQRELAKKRRGRPPKRKQHDTGTPDHSEKDYSRCDREGNVTSKDVADASSIKHTNVKEDRVTDDPSVEDFSDWEPTEKKFKKRKKPNSKRPSAANVKDNVVSDTDEQETESHEYKRYEHKIKTDRSFNKELYRMNKELAADMNYDLSDSVQICIICGNRSSTQWNLLVHLRRFHVMAADDYFQILVLPTEERTKKLEDLRDLKVQNVKKHSPKMAGKLPCSYCTESFLGIRNMKRHLMLKHRKEPDVDEKVTYFTKEFAKLIHKNRMIAIRKENLTKTEYPCRYCGLVLAMSCTRSRHQMYTCSQNPDRKKRVHCSYCGTAYKTHEALEKHMAKHAEHDFKYVCELCGKVCKNKPMMYEHRLKDHSGKPLRYPCSICDKAFHYKDQIKKHEATHSDVREAMCNICGKMFKTKNDVRKHTKHVHDGNYPYHCHLCGHGVAKLSYLTSHKCGRVRRPREGLMSTQQPAQAAKKPKRVRKSTKATLPSGGDAAVNIPQIQSSHDHQTLYNMGYYKQETGEASILPTAPTVEVSKGTDETALASQYLLSNTLPPMSYHSETQPATSLDSSSIQYLSTDRNREYTLLPSMASMTSCQTLAAPVGYPTTSYPTNSAPITFYSMYDNQMPQPLEPTSNPIPQGMQTTSNPIPQVVLTTPNTIPHVLETVSNNIPHDMQAASNSVSQGIPNMQNPIPLGVPTTSEHILQVPQGMQDIRSAPQSQMIHITQNLIPQVIETPSHSTAQTVMVSASNNIPVQSALIPQTVMSALNSIPGIQQTTSLPIPHSVMTTSNCVVAANNDMAQATNPSSSLTDVVTTNSNNLPQQIQRAVPQPISQMPDYKQQQYE